MYDTKQKIFFLKRIGDWFKRKDIQSVKNKRLKDAKQKIFQSECVPDSKGRTFKAKKQKQTKNKMNDIKRKKNFKANGRLIWKEGYLRQKTKKKHKQNEWYETKYLSKRMRNWFKTKGHSKRITISNEWYKIKINLPKRMSGQFKWKDIQSEKKEWMIYNINVFQSEGESE